MGRTAMTIGFSVPAEIKKEVEALAIKTNMTKSQLFREMLKTFKRQQVEDEFFSLQEKITQSTGKIKIFTEEEIEKIAYRGR